LIEKYPQQVRLVFKNFPLRNHKFARQAAAAALAAHQQGKFWEFHDRIFAAYRALNEDKIKEIRDGLNLNKIDFESQRKAPQIIKQIRDDVGLANDIGVRGTPAVFVNGRRQGSRSFTSLSSAVAAALSRMDQSKK
jgi:protein-disulfide isomerase